ncbi:MAG: hypothetical protein RIT35_667 [Pseudomonadota bacterium]|jgi:hypothetical protein
MKSRQEITLFEWKHCLEYQEYYTDRASLAQAIIYLAFSLKPMEDRWHRIKRKTPLYKINHAKSAEIFAAREQLFTALMKGQVMAYDQNLASIPPNLWDIQYVDIDASHLIAPVVYTDIFINSADLYKIFPFDYQNIILPSKSAQYYQTEDTAFIAYVAKYFFDDPANFHYTESAKKLASTIQEKYFELTSRKLSDNKAKIIASFLKTEHLDHKIIRKMKI